MLVAVRQPSLMMGRLQLETRRGGGGWGGGGDVSCGIAAISIDGKITI